MGARGPRFAAFDTYHPAVAAAYVLVTLALTMFSVQPVLIVLSLAGALAYGVLSRGAAACLRALRWQLPTIALIALANPLFSASGSTVLFCLGPRAVYLENIAYGCAMGGLFVASVLWFEAAADMLPQDRVMALAGNAAPTIALMVSMCMRLIPKFVRRGRLIAEVQGVLGVGAGSDGGASDLSRVEGTSVSSSGDAGAAGFAQDALRQEGAGEAGDPQCGLHSEDVLGGGAACPGGHAGAPGTSSAASRGLRGRASVRMSRRRRTAALLRQTHVLMGWSMEDSLECADAMRARGWSACMRRTSYTRFSFGEADAVALVLLLLGGAFCLLLSYAATSQYAFYPTMSHLVAWWGYVPYAAWMLVPSVLLVFEKRMFR